MSFALGFDTFTNQRDGRKSISGFDLYLRDHQRALHHGPHKRGPAFVAKTARPQQRELLLCAQPAVHRLRLQTALAERSWTSALCPAAGLRAHRARTQFANSLNPHSYLLHETPHSTRIIATRQTTHTAHLLG